MDEIDRKILDILEKDSRTPFVEIAKRVGLSEGAVRKRVKDLIKSEAIKKFTILTGVEKKPRALVLVNTMPNFSLSSISRKAKSITGVKEVFEISGEYDLVCFIEGENIKEINEVVDEIRKIRGVSKTTTALVLK